MRESDAPRLLIGTLYAGEAEIVHYESALQAQTYRLWERIRLDNLSERDGHKKLYQERCPST